MISLSIGTGGGAALGAPCLAPRHSKPRTAVAGCGSAERPSPSSRSSVQASASAWRSGARTTMPSRSPQRPASPWPNRSPAPARCDRGAGARRPPEQALAAAEPVEAATIEEATRGGRTRGRASPPRRSAARQSQLVSDAKNVQEHAQNRRGHAGAGTQEAQQQQPRRAHGRSRRRLIFLRSRSRPRGIEPRAARAFRTPPPERREDRASGSERRRESLQQGRRRHRRRQRGVQRQDRSRASAKVASGPFKGTPVGSCIESAVKRARVPRFKQSSFKVTFPYRL